MITWFLSRHHRGFRYLPLSFFHSPKLLQLLALQVPLIHAHWHRVAKIVGSLQLLWLALECGRSSAGRKRSVSSASRVHTADMPCNICETARRRFTEHGKDKRVIRCQKRKKITGTRKGQVSQFGHPDPAVFAAALGSLDRIPGTFNWLYKLIFGFSTLCFKKNGRSQQTPSRRNATSFAFESSPARRLRRHNIGTSQSSGQYE